MISSFGKSFNMGLSRLPTTMSIEHSWNTTHARSFRRILSFSSWSCSIIVFNVSRHLHIKRIVSESEDTLKASTVCLDHYQTVFGTLENFSFVHFLNPTPDRSCETQPPASIGWVALSSVFGCLFVVPHRWHLLSSPLYDVSVHTNHIFSVRIWSWQHVSVNIFCCWVEPSLLLSSLPSIQVWK